MTLKIIAIYTAILLLASCSNMQHRSHCMRTPAEDSPGCQDLAKKIFMKENYKEDLNQALIDKKLLTYTNKFVTIQHPHTDWINKSRAALNRSLKNWNNNKYPAFYMFNDEQVVTEAKKYFTTIKNMTTTSKPTKSTDLLVISQWIRDYKNYKDDIKNLLEERITIQYNLKILKKFKQTQDVQDIKLIIKKNGRFTEEVLTLRKSDKDKNTVIAKLKNDIKELDGTVLTNGKIKDRIIRQAILKDFLTITHREFEYGVKNTSTRNKALLAELEKFNKLINRNDLNPTTYGIYRVTNKIFISEILSATKLDLAYKIFVKNPALKIKEILDAFMKKKTHQTEKEKIGVLKRIYAKVTGLTPKQIAIGSSTVVIAKLGFDRYFSITGEPQVIEQVKVEETKTQDAKEEVVTDQEHQEQLERTQEEETKKADEYYEVIEEQLDGLFN